MFVSNKQGIYDLREGVWMVKDELPEKKCENLDRKISAKYALRIIED